MTEPTGADTASAPYGVPVAEPEARPNPEIVDGSTDQETSEDAGGKDDAEEFADLLQPGGRHSWVVGAVRAQASFVGTTHIGSVVIGSDRNDRQHVPVPLTDLAALHADAPFVPPPGYEELKKVLRGQRVVVCHGPDGCGKELAVTRALQEVGEEVIHLLPVSLDVSLTRRVIEVAAAAGGAYVLPGLDEKALHALAGIAGQSIQELAREGHVKVVVVTAATPGTAVRRNFAVASLDYPDAAQVLDSYCTDRAMAPEARQLASDAITMLGPPVGPVVITAVLDQAANSKQSAEELAGTFSGALTANAVQSWVTGRLPAEIAMLVAGASLPGVSVVVAQEQALKLRDMLTAGQPDNGTLSDAAQPAVWPAGLLRTRTFQLNTHFGRQPLDVIDIAAPHQPHGVIQAAWRSLGAGFHGAYCDWLAGLPGIRQLRWHAAYTAGVLFAIDPVIIEGRVLRTWLHSRDPAVQRCAGLALGAPIAIGADSTGARKLAHAWATNNSREMRRAAVAAYGGLLGAWDTASAAPLKLFLIGQVTPDPGLRGEADLAMARLVVAGADSVAARSTVIAYLRMAAETSSTRDRAYGCLPLIIRLLNAPSSVCAESFAALREEEENWTVLIGLLGSALVSGVGREAGQLSLGLFVRAAADGALEYEVIEDVIRGMRAQQRRLGNAPRLGGAVRRTLVMLSRSTDLSVRDIALGLLNKFFG